MSEQPVNPHVQYLTEWAAFGIAVGYLLVDAADLGLDFRAAVEAVATTSQLFDECACGKMKYSLQPTCVECDK